MSRIHIWQVITVILMITGPTLFSAHARAHIPEDKWLHAGAGIAIGASGYAIGSFATEDPWLRAATGLTLATAAGGLKEWADYHGNGESSAGDFLATLTGAAITLGLILIWDHISPYKEKEKSSIPILPSSLNRETASGRGVYQEPLRIRPIYESELSQRISRHPLQIGPPVLAGISTDSHHCALHRPCRALFLHQLFLH